MFTYIEHVSYLGIVMVLVLTGTGIPIPEELTVVVAGVAARTGNLQFWPAYFACLVGAILGDLVMYGIGYHFGRSVLLEHRFLARHLTPERERQIEEMISLHGFKVLFVSRFLVGFRSPVFLTAGILRMPLRKFLLFDGLSVFAVVSVFFGLAYRYGESIQDWWKYLRGAEYALSGTVVLAIVVAVIWYVRRVRMRRARLILRRAQRSARLSQAKVATKPEVKKSLEPSDTAI